MANSTRLVKSFTRLLFPVVLLVVIAMTAGAVWLVYTTARPVHAQYLVTPDKFGQLSTRAAQVTEETWPNKDGSSTRGWLLRGAEGAPAVILLHKFGADRSYVLNLGVKLNESTNFTVLMPDQRGHGQNPPVQNASFGGCETEDSVAAIQFLKNLRTTNNIAMVDQSKMGIFGVEMGAMVAVATAANDKTITAVAVDSVPSDSDGVLMGNVDRRFPFASFATSRLAQVGARMYYFDGCYQREAVCETSKRVDGRDVLLLAGVDAPEFQESTSKLSKCFAPSNRLQSKTDLSPSGYSIINASMEQSETYDQRLIDFFRTSLAPQ